MTRDTFGIDGVLRPSGTRWLRRDGFPGLKPWAIVARPSGTKGRYANGTLEACDPREMPKLGTAGLRAAALAEPQFSFWAVRAKIRA
jgi:hypothetical protein